MSIETTALQTRGQVAVIGSGYWGKNLVRNFHSLGALAAICDSDESRRNILRNQFPDVKIEDSFDEVLKQDSIDAELSLRLRKLMLIWLKRLY